MAKDTLSLKVEDTRHVFSCVSLDLEGLGLLIRIAALLTTSYSRTHPRARAHGFRAGDEVQCGVGVVGSRVLDAAPPSSRSSRAVKASLHGGS
eukprot:347828-Amphidinium_carterae.1